jgi:A/G-specific adenine glycosylase
MNAIMNTESQIDKRYTLDVDDFRGQMLSWYRQNARKMPWRASFGQCANPYHEWLSEIMLQQTTVKTVIPYFEKFISLWPSVHDLAEAPVEDIMREWAGLGYYARARNLHKCAKVISQEYEGHFPEDENGLVSLPGIGPYTAAAIRAIAFQQPATVMDGNVERVLTRLFLAKKPLRENKKELKEYADFLSKERADQPGDFAQSMMELGALICTPKSPSCHMCPVQSFCSAYQANEQNNVPVLPIRKKIPVREGNLYFIRNNKGEVLFEKRSIDRMLGGMWGIPGTNWDSGGKKEDGEIYKNLKLIDIPDFYVRHTFSHFHLELKGYLIDIETYSKSDFDGMLWYNVTKSTDLGLPTLYQKAIQQFISKGI